MCFFFVFLLGRFYELKKARSPLQLYDRFDYTDPETNICIERVSHLFKSITVDISLYSELHPCVHLIGFYLEMQNFHFLCGTPVAICASYLPDYWRILMRAKPGMCLFLSSNFSLIFVWFFKSYPGALVASGAFPFPCTPQY